MKKYFVFTIILFSCLNCYFCYDIEYIEVNENNPTYEKAFEINKIKDYNYNLSFTHYGNINSSMKVEVYLNNHLIYIIDDSNDASPRYNKSVTIDITNYLINGKNSLKVDGVNLISNKKYHPYYVLNNGYINEPNIKSPIDNEVIIMSMLLMGIVIVLYNKK